MGCLRGIPACVVAGHDDLRDAHGGVQSICLVYGLNSHFWYAIHGSLCSWTLFLSIGGTLGRFLP